MGLSAAFLGGFVDAANRSVYENRMAKHEQSIQDRANFREDEKEAKARARQDKLLADKNKREDRLITDAQTYEEGLDTRLKADEIVAAKTAADLRAEQKAKIIATVHPGMTPEQ